MPSFEQIPTSNGKESLENDQESREFSPEEVYSFLKRAYAEAQSGNISRESSKELSNRLESVSEDKQKSLAEQFHKEFVEDLGKTKESYKVYLALKGSAFSNEFSKIEDERLKEEGFEGFNL